MIALALLRLISWANHCWGLPASCQVSYRMTPGDGLGYSSLSLTSRGGTELRGFGALPKVKECNSWDSAPSCPVPLAPPLSAV